MSHGLNALNLKCGRPNKTADKTRPKKNDITRLGKFRSTLLEINKKFEVMTRDVYVMTFERKKVHGSAREVNKNNVGNVNIIEASAPNDFRIKTNLNFHFKMCISY